MFDFFKYQLITAIALTIFYTIYKIFLKKETFFNINRFYLIFALALALALPYIKINSSVAEVKYIQNSQVIQPIRENISC